MRKWILHISFLILSLDSYSQVKFLSQIDTNYISNQYLDDSLDVMEFYGDARLNEEFDPLNPDIELLNAGLFVAIQRERKRRAREILAFSEKQYTLCAKFLEFYLPDRFETDEENIEKFTKTTKKALKKIKFPKGISKVLTFKFRAMNFKGYNFYYLKTAHETELKLFKGAKPEIRDSTKLAELKKVPVPTFTYKGLIDNFVKNVLKKKYSKLLYSKEYSSLACYFKLDKRTLNRNKIPEVALIMIYGADRLKYMEVAKIKSKKQKKLL